MHLLSVLLVIFFSYIHISFLWDILTTLWCQKRGVAKYFIFDMMLYRISVFYVRKRKKLTIFQQENVSQEVFTFNVIKIWENAVSVTCWNYENSEDIEISQITMVVVLSYKFSIIHCVTLARNPTNHVILCLFFTYLSVFWSTGTCRERSREQLISRLEEAAALKQHADRRSCHLQRLIAAQLGHSGSALWRQFVTRQLRLVLKADDILDQLRHMERQRETLHILFVK